MTKTKTSDAYAKVLASEWGSKISPLLKKHGNDVVLFWYYLRSGPHRKMSGIFSLPAAYVAHDLGVDLARVEELIDILEAEGVLTYDHETEEVYVYDMVKSQVSESLKPLDKRAIHIEKQIDNVRSGRIVNAFCEQNPWIYGDDDLHEQSSKFSAPALFMKQEMGSSLVMSGLEDDDDKPF